MAIMALEEAVGATNPYHSALHQGYQWVKAIQLEDGGWPTLNSRGSDIAPISLFLFASHKTKNELGQSLLEPALSWIKHSVVPQHEWVQGNKWCSYETFDEPPYEWPRRKYFALPFAIAGAYCYGRGIPLLEKILHLLFDCQEESGRWILPSETGEEIYTWYTY